jgi:hypothetical protein
MLFGVDVAAPTAVMNDAGLLQSSAGVNGSIGANVGGEFLVTAIDTGIVGTSGIPSANSLLATVVIRSPTLGLTPAQVCPVGTVVSGACTASFAGTGFKTTTVIAAQSITGYYIFTGQVVDAAGNLSGVLSRVHTYEPGVAPTVTAPVYDSPLSGPTATFSSGATDNFDLWFGIFQVTYAGAPAPVVFPAMPLNTFNTAPFVNSNALLRQIVNGFMRQAEFVSGVSPLTLTGPAKVGSATAFAFDMVGLQSVSPGTVIPPAAVTTGVSYLDPVAFPAAKKTDSWKLTDPASAISTGAGPAAAVNPLSLTLTATLNGPTGTFATPFSSVYFFVQTAFGLEPIGSVRGFIPADDGSPFGRSFTYVLGWTPGTTSPASQQPWVLGAHSIYAVGISANGDGLFALGTGTVTLTNP